MRHIDLPDIQAFVDTEPPGAWERAIARRFGKPPLSASRTATKYLEKSIASEAARSVLRFGRIHDLLLLALAVTNGDLVDNYAVLRNLTPSKVPRSQSRKLSAMYHRLVESSAPWLMPEAARRLCAMASYCDLYSATLATRLSFEKAIQQAPKAFLRTMITSAEIQFAGFEPPRTSVPGSALIHHERDLSLEDYASGVSYILTTWNALKKIDGTEFGPCDGAKDPVGDSLPFVRAACDLFELDQAGVDVFRGSYGCCRGRGDDWLVLPPTDQLGRARELGNIETQIQESIRVERSNRNQDGGSFADFVTQVFKKVGGRLFEFTKQGPRRLRFFLMEPITRPLGREILLKDSLFREERHWLEGTNYELVTSADALQAFRIGETLTMWDVFLISRIFRLLALARNELLAEERPRNVASFLTSLLTMTTKESFVTLLGLFSVDESKAKEYLELFLWNTDRPDSFADIQYKSFILAGNTVVLPLSIHANSNVLRNVLIVSQKRLSSGTQPDLVTEHLHDVLAESQEQVRRDIKFKYQGEQSDLDVVLKLGGTLFVFECKNTIKPCSSFEMRATWDQLDKAVSQLDRLHRLWKEMPFRRTIEGKLGLSLTNVTQLFTSIVLSHRLFGGANYHGYAVRSLHALANFVSEGTTFLTVEDKTETVRNWKGDKLTEDDLMSFLTEGGAVYGALSRSQRRVYHARHFGKFRMVRPRYPLVFAKMLRELGWRIEETDLELDLVLNAVDQDY